MVWTFICSAFAILALDVVGADVEFAADLMGAQFGLNRAGVVEQLSRDCGIAVGGMRTCSGESQSGKSPA
jgi:hypothetical protein